MKILNIIIEIITAPLYFILRISGVGNKSRSSYAKPLVIFLISLVLVVLIVLFYYREDIFR